MKRKAGIEYLRIIAMICIIADHFWLFTGALDNVKPFTFNYYMIWFLEAIGYIGVDCYVLISGYFLIKSKFSWKKVISLIAEVWLYSVLTWFVLLIMKQDIKYSLINVLLPVSTRQYWFVTDYIALYILSPFINYGLEKLEKKNFLELIVVLILMFSIWELLPGEQLGGEKGYSLYWLITVYCIGAYIRLYGEKLKICWGWLTLCGGILMFASKIVFSMIARYIPGVEPYSTVFYAHSSIFVVLMAIGLFMQFKDLQNTNSKTEKLILYISPLTFGVYLLHMNPNLSNIYWRFVKQMVNINNKSIFLFWLIAIVFIYIICTAIDAMRHYVDVKIKKLIFDRGVGSEKK